MNIVKGNLIKSMLKAEYDVAVQGCNCNCIQKSGLAQQMVRYFSTNSTVYFPMESDAAGWCKNINKLGCIDYARFFVDGERSVFVNALTAGRREEPIVTIVNCYIQIAPGVAGKYGIPLDYDALTLCLRKVNAKFAGKSVALPKIGCGLAGGDWNKVLEIIENELIDVQPTIIEL